MWKEERKMRVSACMQEKHMHEKGTSGREDNNGCRQKYAANSGGAKQKCRSTC